MRRAKPRAALVIGWLLVACAGPDPARETVTDAVLALDTCNETVPADRAVDGLPAYAQCSASENANIWSNNGVDTSTTSLGDDWVQTQRGGGYQCTEWAYRYMHFRFGIDYRHGDAKDWCDGALPSTLVKATVPGHGDLIVFQGGVCGADATTGHIAVIDSVDTTAGKVTIVEENRAGRRSANQSCGSCFLHAVENDGTPSGSAGMPATAGSSGGGAANAAGGVSGRGGGLSAGNGGKAQAGSPAVGGRGSLAGDGGAPPVTGVGGGGMGPSSTAGTATTGGTAGQPSLASAGAAAGLAGAGRQQAGNGAGGLAIAGAGAGTADAPLDVSALPPDAEGGCAVVAHRRSVSDGSVWLVLTAGLSCAKRRASRRERACSTGSGGGARRRFPRRSP